MRVCACVKEAASIHGAYNFVDFRWQSGRRCSLSSAVAPVRVGENALVIVRARVQCVDFRVSVRACAVCVQPVRGPHCSGSIHMCARFLMW